jgi:hypothetical protein
VDTIRDSSGQWWEVVGEIARAEVDPPTRAKWESKQILAALELMPADGDGPAQAAVVRESGDVELVNPSAFDRCVASVERSGSSYSPRGVCAAAGRRKYGAKRFQQMAAAGRRRRARPNPEETAAELAAVWYGRPAETVTELQEETHVHEYLTDLGRLVELEIAPLSGRRPTKVIPLEFAASEDVRLASSERESERVWEEAFGDQLFIKGSVVIDDQTLKRLGVPESQWGRESVILGECTAVVYHAAKHTNAHKPATYRHAFGEEGGELPQVVWASRDFSLRFQGGSYTVESPGIIN